MTPTQNVLVMFSMTTWNVFRFILLRFEGPGGVGGVLDFAIGGPRLVARAIARGKEDLQVQEVMARRASARG